MANTCWKDPIYIGFCDYDYGHSYIDKIVISRCCVSKQMIYKTFENDSNLNINFIEEAAKIIQNKQEPIVNKKCESCGIYCKVPEKLDSIQVSLYAACNARCEFCFVARNHGFKNSNKELYLKTLYNAKGKVKKLKLTDRGEPLMLQKEMKEFFKSLKPGDFEEIFFNTNGILLDEEFIQIMKDAPVHFSICVSINAPNRELYKKIVGVDAFDKVIENINKIPNNINVALSAIYYEPLFGTLPTFKQELGKIIYNKDIVNSLIIILMDGGNRQDLLTDEYKKYMGI